ATGGPRASERSGDRAPAGAAEPAGGPAPPVAGKNLRRAIRTDRRPEQKAEHPYVEMTGTGVP
ncbi:MAG: hypothetical protein ACRDYW_13280, partial [Acidimicrobiales bacterium]